jgi:hypothetical protein
VISLTGAAVSPQRDFVHATFHVQVSPRHFHLKPTTFQRYAGLVAKSLQGEQVGLILCFFIIENFL